ncbi:LYR motif-containing protein 4-like isoform X2 [Dipodomys spectabilis]|uniref:LYR motif-containing protein 4-like isoform X2 n=1 Tax=Dipodomys spectabilis TaxID=105255 RepID=UPI001C5353B6|nr:LYR motif-containing protein 4-like isoform X2 [Dipodomys spectabilis]
MRGFAIGRNFYWLKPGTYAKRTRLFLFWRLGSGLVSFLPLSPSPSKMAASSRAQVLDLYRAMLRESKHFNSYNYRTYAVRRIRDAFRENKNVKDPVEIQALVNKAKRDLGLIRRQEFQ